jgi:hypothetical protein
MAYTTIDDPEAYFQITTWTGNGSTRSITLGGDTDMQPDLVWIQNRGGTYAPPVFDSVRGATKFLEVHDNTAEQTVANTLTSFDSDGFSLGADTSSYVNRSSSPNTYVAWCWKESATAGFDIVSFTGNATDDRDISHSLSAVPHFWVTRNRPDAENWLVYHHKNTSAPETDYLLLDEASATADNSIVWSDEAPTSSVYTVGTANSVNGNTDAMITYLWSEKQGFSKFGSYTGNVNADGPFIYTGFSPAFFMFAETGNAEGFIIYDNKRSDSGGSNPNDQYIAVSSANAEASGVAVDFVSNGVKLRVNNGHINEGTYIYAAFAEAPFVNSNGVPCNAR